MMKIGSLIVKIVSLIYAPFPSSNAVYPVGLLNAGLRLLPKVNWVGSILCFLINGYHHSFSNFESLRKDTLF